jgi:hypothetical protein
LDVFEGTYLRFTSATSAVEGRGKSRQLVETIHRKRESQIAIPKTQLTFPPLAQRNAFRRFDVRIDNKDGSPVGIHSCDTAPVPTAVVR